MSKSSTMFTPVLIAGCMIILISFLVRASFGVFQIPIAEEFEWARAEFSLAIAIQNLAWARQPLLEEERAERSLSTIGARHPQEL